MKNTYLVFAFFMAIGIVSSQDISLGDFVKVPIEKKHKLNYKVSSESKVQKFKYATLVEDPNGILSYFNLTSQKLNSYLRIPGQTRTENIEDAEVVYKYAFKNAEVTDEEVYKTGKTMMTGTVGRPYYRAKGVYNIDACVAVFYPKKGGEASCSTIYEFQRMTIETEEDLDPNAVVTRWNSSGMKDVVGDEVKSVLKKDFGEQTGGAAIVTEFSSDFYLARFGQKDTKAHKKKTSDDNVKKVQGLIKLYKYDFNDYFVYTCSKDNSLKDMGKCFESFRDKIQQKKDEIPETVSFWKNELQTKYTKVGKKSNIRSAMALNLFTSALMTKDFESVEYALKILSEENYGRKEHNKTSLNELKALFQIMKLKPFEFIPKYYSYGVSGSGGYGVKGSDYPLK